MNSNRVETLPKHSEKAGNSLPPLARSAWRRYSVAFLCVLIAFCVRYWLTPVLGGDLPFLIFIAAALFAAWYGGAVAGIMALGLGLSLADFFFVPRELSSGISHSVEFVQVIRYIFTASLGVTLIEVLRHSRRRAEIAAEDLRREVALRKKSEQELLEAKIRLSHHAEELERCVAERTSELSATVESLKSVLYQIAHNFRAPLRAIHGYTSLLTIDRSSEAGPTPQECSEHIFDAVRRMDMLTHDLLEYGRLGHVKLELIDFGLKEAVEGALYGIAQWVQNSGAKIEIADPLPQVRANVGMVEQIAVNLLENALKFAAPGETPRIRIWAEERQNAVRLYLEDNGIGIAPEYHDRIFEPFEHLHSQNSYEGTGIGLAIVRQGMERMGGRAGVESKPGEGSRFWLEFMAASRKQQSPPSKHGSLALEHDLIASAVS